MAQLARRDKLGVVCVWIIKVQANCSLTFALSYMLDDNVIGTSPNLAGLSFADTVESLDVSGLENWRAGAKGGQNCGFAVCLRSSSYLFSR